MTRPPDEDGYELWLRYRRVENPLLLERYRRQLGSIVLLDARGAESAAVLGGRPILAAAVAELQRGLGELLGRSIGFGSDPNEPGALLLGHIGSPGLEEFQPF
ncbi:MAG TPA: alpha-glucuronidase family glycosyl hydrolase, partial [Polyangiaceae bacterium]|nr:alpha-glucuronidase family glycosyl hydrolase [Polyangiaceae bacterium]